MCRLIINTPNKISILKLSNNNGKIIGSHFNKSNSQSILLTI